MQASPVLGAMVRVLEATQALGPNAQLDSVVREMRMAEADLRAALEALEMAHDDEARLSALKRRNRATRWLGVLVTTVADLLERTTPT
ncbi:MAG: hypothetical protein IT353_10160 [Gemmatimonadaceae bacterium]|nr:hypothetical protein [Gemmatimonadaceae bacterium]